MKYYDNNITSTLVLCEIMAKRGCKNIIFSSSATVYGEPASVPCTEDFPTAALNPSGRTKLFIEHILSDLYVSDKTWKVALLRYFNPVGAHASGTLGEDQGYSEQFDALRATSRRRSSSSSTSSGTITPPRTARVDAITFTSSIWPTGTSPR